MATYGHFIHEINSLNYLTFYAWRMTMLKTKEEIMENDLKQLKDLVRQMIDAHNTGNDAGFQLVASEALKALHRLSNGS